MVFVLVPCAKVVVRFKPVECVVGISAKRTTNISTSVAFASRHFAMIAVLTYVQIAVRCFVMTAQDQDMALTVVSVVVSGVAINVGILQLLVGT